MLKANRITGSSINWIDLTSRVPPKQKSRMKSFKERHDTYLKKLHSNPVTPPKIHWEFYRQQIGKKYCNWLNEFETKYKSFKIPYPIDVYTEKLNENKSQMKRVVKEYIEKSNENIELYRKELDIINERLPYEQMTQEDFMEAHPELAYDFLKKPTFWPHTPEEQIGYVAPIDPKFIIDEKKLS